MTNADKAAETCADYSSVPRVTVIEHCVYGLCSEMPARCNNVLAGVVVKYKVICD